MSNVSINNVSTKNINNILEGIDDINTLHNLYREEESGKERKTVMNAILWRLGALQMSWMDRDLEEETVMTEEEVIENMERAVDNVNEDGMMKDQKDAFVKQKEFLKWIKFPHPVNPDFLAALNVTKIGTNQVNVWIEGQFYLAHRQECYLLMKDIATAAKRIGEADFVRPPLGQSYLKIVIK